MTSLTQIMTSYPLFQNTFILRSPEIASSPDIIKIAIMLNKTTLRDSIKVKRIKQNFLKVH